MSADLIMNAKEIAEVLSRPFPKKLIKKLDKGRGLKFDYVEQASVIRRLNEAFGWDGWSFEVDVVKETANAVVIKGVLYVAGRTKEQFGHARVGKGMDLGDSYKSAASDAMKKCATLLGVALHLYENETEASLMASDKNYNETETSLTASEPVRHKGRF